MFKNINHYKHKRKISFENEVRKWNSTDKEAEKRTHTHTPNNTIRTRKSNILYILYSILLRKTNKKTHMHHTTCTLVIQMNVQNELKKNRTRTHILMQKKIKKACNKHRRLVSFCICTFNLKICFQKLLLLFIR